MADKPYAQCLASDPAKEANVCLDIVLNKDGHYAVRPLVLSNPYLYYFLAREIATHWDALKDCFTKFSTLNFEVPSMPLQPDKRDERNFKNATSVFNWWRAVESRSVELSLDYRYMFVTDITNCYEAITPQAIDWALAMKDTQHETDANKEFSDNIKTYISAMRQGRNIGIPQGSPLFDLVAEVVLGYADLLLHKAIGEDKETADTDYKVIRFRDDYRVFCNDKDRLEKISYKLQHVLGKLHFNMNPKKTRISDSIVTDAIKPEKLDYIYNGPVIKKNKDKDCYDCIYDGLYKHLMFILLFGRKHPNSNHLKTLLSEFDKRLQEWLKPRKKTLYGNEAFANITKKAMASEGDKPDSDDDVEMVTPHLRESVGMLVAIATQIALENVNSAQHALQVINRLVESLDDAKEKWSYYVKVVEKMRKQPNNHNTQLWLQRITYNLEKVLGKCPYDMPLCRFVAGERDVVVWNNSWLKPELTEGFPLDSIVDAEVMNNLTPVFPISQFISYDDGDEPEEEEEY
ncbi:MAG: RNA-directed DNA polymerase [Bacteroidales bacterium]|nr:RNA-directed DNA polymerase [Bacteroidales bacterium]